jgi:hypothetical protein
MALRKPGSESPATLMETLPFPAGYEIYQCPRWQKLPMIAV